MQQSRTSGSVSTTGTDLSLELPDSVIGFDATISSFPSLLLLLLLLLLLCSAASWIPIEGSTISNRGCDGCPSPSSSSSSSSSSASSCSTLRRFWFGLLGPSPSSYPPTEIFTISASF